MGLSACKQTTLDPNLETLTIITSNPSKPISSTSVPDPIPIQVPTITPALPQLPTPSNLLPTQDPISLQGELKKFQPECKSKFISRWVQLTPTHIKYFKNEYSSCFYWNKPLTSIPLIEIQKILLISENHQFGFEVIQKNPGLSEEKNLNISKKIIFIGEDLNEVEKWICGFSGNGVKVNRN